MSGAVMDANVDAKNFDGVARGRANYEAKKGKVGRPKFLS